MAIRLGVPGLRKAESTAGKYFCRLSWVYRGIQSAGVVNWPGGHSTRRPSLLRIGSQCSVITSGRSVSDAAVQGTKRLELSMSLLEGKHQPPIPGDCPSCSGPSCNPR